MKSPINGSELVKDPSTGLLYSESDGLYYAMNENGIMPLKEEKYNNHISR